MAEGRAAAGNGPLFEETKMSTQIVPVEGLHRNANHAGLGRAGTGKGIQVIHVCGCGKIITGMEKMNAAVKKGPYI